MDVSDVIKLYLPKINVMQLATSHGGQPWVCSLHYYSDQDLNLYWLSLPSRRHSQELSTNPKSAITIKVHENSANEDFLIGITLEGKTEALAKNKVNEIAHEYQVKHGTSATFMNSVVSGQNPHIFYKFAPEAIVLFDTKDFPGDSRKEWSLTK